MATANDLPKEFDVVVLGTGMPESIVAAAFSRIGQSVLHLDRNDHYSGDWASFNLQGIENWAQRHQIESATSSESDLARPAIDESSLLEEGETLVELPVNNTNFSNVLVQYYVQESDEIDEENARKEKQEESPHTKTSEASDVGLSEEWDTSEAAGKQEETDEEAQLPSGYGEEKTSTETENVTDVSEAADEKTTESQLQDLSINDTEKTKESLVDTDAEVVKESESEGSENMTRKKSDGQVEETGAKLIDSETVEQNASTGGAETEKAKKSWTVKRLKAEWRKFNLDLSPKVLYSVGDMVELLISSDIAKYCEFKTITQIITLMNGNLEKVPCSRADVFSSKKVSMLEKRMLMKFLQYCLQYEDKPEEIQEFLDRPFCDFLTHKKLTPTIKHYIQHSIAMATDTMSTKEGLENMKKFLKSLGRYGNTAFLWSLYGSGELPQSFCRMCAVFGGVYCLRMTASSVVMDSQNRCCAVVTTDGQRIKCKWLVMEGSYAPAGFICEENNSAVISRAIILTDRPLLTTGQQEQLSLMNLPCPDDGDRPISVLELPPSSMAAPLGVYVYHLTRKGKDKVLPKDDLMYAVTTLFSSEENVDERKPVMLWSMFFTQKDMSEVKAGSSVPENVFLMNGPGIHRDIDRPVQEAKEIFKRILPEEEFLPKAPNPEDIIYVDDSEAQVADSSTQSEFSEKLEPDTGSQEVDANKVEQTETAQSERSEQQDQSIDHSESSGEKTDQSQCSSQKPEDIPETSQQSESSSNGCEEQKN